MPFTDLFMASFFVDLIWVAYKALSASPLFSCSMDWCTSLGVTIWLQIRRSQQQPLHIVTRMPRHPVGLDHRVSPLGSFIRQQPLAPRLGDSDRTNHMKSQCELGALTSEVGALALWLLAGEASMPRHTTLVALRSKIAPSPRAVPPTMTLKS